MHGVRNKVSLIPGPVAISTEILTAMARDFGSADLEEDFFQLYEETSRWAAELLRVSAHTSQGPSVVLLPGEGMLGLWAVVHSAVAPGSRVVVLVNGVFGQGFAEMLSSIGAHVASFDLPYDQPLTEAHASALEAFCTEARPQFVFAVHCETPSGLLNDLKVVSAAAHGCGALLAVDYVSSAGGALVEAGDWGIDFGMLGSQKVLASTPDVSLVQLSAAAWECVAKRGYVGYDALLPWRDAMKKRETPYTFPWNALAALHTALAIYRREDPESALARHHAAALHVRRRVREMGLQLYGVQEDAAPGWSSTVTCVVVPASWTWKALDAELRSRGIVLGGSWGPLAGRVFRIGHMGPQANQELLDIALNQLQEIVLNSNPSS